MVLPPAEEIEKEESGPGPFLSSVEKVIMRQQKKKIAPCGMVWYPLNFNHPWLSKYIPKPKPKKYKKNELQKLQQ